MRQSGRKKGSQNQAPESEIVPVPMVRSLTLHTCDMYVKGLGQSNAGSLVVGSTSVSPHEARLVDSMGFPVVALTLVPVNSSSVSSIGFSEFQPMFVCGSLQHTAFLMRDLGPNLDAALRTFQIIVWTFAQARPRFPL